MADGHWTRRRQAVHAVEAAFAPVCQRLDSGSLRSRYPNRALAAGWRIRIKFSDGIRRLDLLVDDGFPWTPAKIALVDRPAFLTWPHVEEDGLLCFLPPDTSVDSSRPVDSVQALLGEACQLVEHLIGGRMSEDFRDEFLSYWTRTGAGKFPPVYCLCDTNGCSRTVYCWRGTSFTVVADTENQLLKWLGNRFPTAEHTSVKVESAFLMTLRDPPVPTEYPSDGRELIAYIERIDPESGRTVKRLAEEAAEKLLVLFCARTKRGPAFAAISIGRPEAARWPGRKQEDRITAGFRPSKVPPSIRASRFLGGKLTKRKVERADHSWVHGRDHDPHAITLHQKSAALIGAGSLGAPVAELLARAGLGKLFIIDPDRLEFPNVGRHILGAADVGRLKAVALAQRLKENLPHMAGVEAVPLRLEQVLNEQSHLLSNCDLLISTTGSWTSESLLNDWHLAHCRPMPVVYGWAEAHACAGHAVAISSQGGCLRCGYDPKGRFFFAATHWPEGTAVQEPGCGAVFQPYGSIGISNIAARVADLSLSLILAPTNVSSHRVWIGDTSKLASLGGALTGFGRELLHDNSCGECVVRHPWPEYCANCTEAAVA